MDKSRRKELLEQYKEIKTYMGVVRVKNKVNGKIFINSYPNLKNKWLMIRMQLQLGQFVNAELQNDWNKLGADAFEYEELERKEADKVTDMRWELKQMLRKWLERLRPYGDQGYNKPPRDMT